MYPYGGCYCVDWVHLSETGQGRQERPDYAVFNCDKDVVGCDDGWWSSMKRLFVTMEMKSADHSNPFRKVERKRIPMRLVVFWTRRNRRFQEVVRY